MLFYIKVLFTATREPSQNAPASKLIEQDPLEDVEET